MAGMCPAVEKAVPEPAAAPTVQETKEQRDARMQWWRDAKEATEAKYAKQGQ